MKALLFINGVAPQVLPDLEDYGKIGCTDGAFRYLSEKEFPLERLDFISGDFDSQPLDIGLENASQAYNFEIIRTPDQDKTDFQKALDILVEMGAREVHVYGGSGKEQDHFLGNLNVAAVMQTIIKITFFDEFSSYFLAESPLTLHGVKGKMISLVPFPAASGITATGLNWPLEDASLSLTGRMGTRNFAILDEVAIRFGGGQLFVFIGDRGR